MFSTGWELFQDELINEFYILKHLPVLEKVEFKEYADRLNQLEKNSVGLVLDDLNISMKHVIKNSKYIHKSYLSGAIGITVNSENSGNIEITIAKRNNHSFTNKYQQGLGLSNFDIIKIGRLFHDYLSDLLMYSNYLEFNKGISIIYQAYSNLDKVRQTYIVTINNLNQSPIKIN